MIQSFFFCSSCCLSNFFVQRKLSWQENQRPNSAIEQFGQQGQNRQSSLDLNRSSSTLLKTNINPEPKFNVNHPHHQKTSSSNLQPEQTSRSNRVYSLSDDEELWNGNDEFDFAKIFTDNNHNDRTRYDAGKKFLDDYTKGKYFHID